MERTTKKSGEELPKKDDAPETPQTDAPETPQTTDEIKKDPDQEPEDTVLVVDQEPKYVDPDPLIKWKKLGGGSLHLPKRLIPPGAVFTARASEIPKAFRDVCQPLEELPSIPEAPVVKPVKSVYQVVPRGKSKSMYDVIGPNGKRMNDIALTKATAERLAQDLS